MILYINNNKINTTKTHFLLNKNVKINVVSRNLMRMLLKPKIIVNPTPLLTKPYSVDAIYKYKNNAKSYAPDNETGHPIHGKISCKNLDCNNVTILVMIQSL